MSDTRPTPATTPTGDDAATNDARGRLERAAAGLVYSSEGDRPFEYVELEPPGALDAGAPITAALVARLSGAARDARIEERTLDAFLARHRDRVDPADAASQALRPRYDALARALRDTLGGSTASRWFEVPSRGFATTARGSSSARRRRVRVARAGSRRRFVRVDDWCRSTRA